MEFGLVTTVVVLLRKCQTLVQFLVRVVEARRLRVRIGQDTVIGRDSHLRPGGPESAKSLAEKRQGFLDSPLKENSRPLVERTQCVPKLKTLFRRNGPLFLGRRLDFGPQSAVLIQK